MLTRRITIAVPETLARALKPRERLLTIPYRKRLVMLGISIPYRIACVIFNECSTRNTDEEKGRFCVLGRKNRGSDDRFLGYSEDEWYNKITPLSML